MYIYDKILGCHISTEPLVVSNRVLKAAIDIDPELRLEWDERGFICSVSHDLATKLTAPLGIRMLSVRDFMHLSQRIPKVRSQDFSKWLSDSYCINTKEKVFDVSSKVSRLYQKPSFSASTLVSDNNEIEIPTARPGWFSLSQIGDNGLTMKLSLLNEPDHWKFWSPESADFICGAMRSFVTSSGTCSLDLEIPVFAKHPKIMIRECYDHVTPPSFSPLSNI